MIKDKNKPIYELHYLSAINQSPKKLLAIDLVLDHAIYMKVLEALHNLRMGGFHACNVFLAVTGKRFGSAGLRDLIVKAHSAGPNQVRGILKGNHYNYGIRISKIVFEALLRLKFECFEKWLEKEGKRDAIPYIILEHQMSFPN